MFNYKMSLSYEGSRYNGWQKQGNTKNTICEKVENVFKTYTNEDVHINASGRTDAGVHALCQVASFSLHQKLDCNNCLSTVNTFLPEDIRILSLTETDERFHARLNAKNKTYILKLRT